MSRQTIQRVGTRDALDFRACDSCGARARFIGLEPDPQGSGATLCTYECAECGDLQTELMAGPMHVNGRSRRAERLGEATMPQAINFVLTRDTNPLELPTCRACGDRMLLARITPHDTDRNTCVRTFECRCGYRILRTARR
jgi:hypothetical protein